MKTEVWQTFFQLDNLYEKETIYKDFSQKSEDQSDTQDFVGFKEGKNENGVIWREDWQKNSKNQYYRWNNYFEEDRDGYHIKYG